MSEIDINYKTKYFKYKNKYLNLKNQLAGSRLHSPPPFGLERSTNEHELKRGNRSPTNPEDDSDSPLAHPPLNPKILQRQIANEYELPSPPRNPQNLQRLKANPTDYQRFPLNRERLQPFDGTSFSSPYKIDPIKTNPSYEKNLYTVILTGNDSGGVDFRDMERQDLENKDILLTNKNHSFLINFSNNLTLFKGKIFSVKINSHNKMVKLTEI
jgi:hypothetical protein